MTRRSNVNLNTPAPARRVTPDSQHGTTGPDSQLVVYAVSGELHNAKATCEGAGHDQGTVVGLDVHAETIAVAVAEPQGEVRALGIIPNRAESIRRLVKKLGPVEQLRVCYEAGEGMCVWQFTALGVACDVIAPTLVPTKAGDRVKTIGATR